MQRHGTSQLPNVKDDKPARKAFKAYPIGFFHIGIAEVQTAEGKLYLFVGINRTSKLAFVRLVGVGAWKRPGSRITRLRLPGQPPCTAASMHQRRLRPDRRRSVGHPGRRRTGGDARRQSETDAGGQGATTQTTFAAACSSKASCR